MTIPEHYVLKELTLDQRPEIEISKEDFQELKSAKRTMLKALACEEKYEMVIHNYLVLEKEFSGIAIQEMIRSSFRRHNYLDLRLSANINIANLLTSARLYTDSLHKDISTCLQNSADSKKWIKKIDREEYRNNFHYRFIYELRNYIQHEALPTHGIRTGERLTQNKQVEGYSDFSVNKKILSEGNFKQEILDEMDEEVNLVLAIRHYIKAVNKIHIQARELIEPLVAEARHCVEAAINRYKTTNTENNSVIGLYAISCNELNSEIDKLSLPVLLDSDDTRLYLKEKNGKHLTNLHRSYATTQTNRKN